MNETARRDDGLCGAVVAIDARHLLSTVCAAGGVDCPLIEKKRAREILERTRRDPTAAIRLESDADTLPHYRAMEQHGFADLDPTHVFNRKRDLDVLQRLGLCPGDTRRARYLYELLFERIATPDGICAHDTPNWQGCPHARSGAYERVRGQGWQAMVYHRTAEEMAEARRKSAEHIATADRLFMRPHHIMCLSCGFAGGENDAPRSNDTLYEIIERIRRDPEVPITLIEGCCMACDCCDGFFPENGRCVHTCGLIRDFKKDLDLFQKLGLMPGATLPARALFQLIYDRIPSTRMICAYGDGVVRSEEWRICTSPDGSPGYLKTREKGVFRK